MDLFDDYEEPLLPVIMDDVTVYLESDYVRDTHTSMGVNGILSRKLLYKDTIPFEIHNKDAVRGVVWMPSQHPLVRLIHVAPIKEVNSRWGDLVVFSEEAVAGAVDAMLQLCEKHNLKIDESDDQ